MLLGLLRTIQRSSIELPGTRIAYFELLQIFKLHDRDAVHKCSMVLGTRSQLVDKMTYCTLA